MKFRTMATCLLTISLLTSGAIIRCMNGKDETEELKNEIAKNRGFVTKRLGAENMLRMEQNLKRETKGLPEKARLKVMLKHYETVKDLFK